MESEKTSNCQSNHEEVEQSEWHNPSRLQTILQSYSNQNSMVLRQKQMYYQWNRKKSPEINPHTLWSITCQQRRQEYTKVKKQSL